MDPNTAGYTEHIYCQHINLPQLSILTNIFKIFKIQKAEINFLNIVKALKI